MPIFRKKQIEIEARQFDGTLECRKRLEADFDVRTVGATTYDGRLLSWRIETIDGSKEVSPGDWIIRGEKGGFYTCKPDIFEATYEPV
jgi:hypothetical protein